MEAPVSWAARAELERLWNKAAAKAEASSSKQQPQHQQHQLQQQQQEEKERAESKAAAAADCGSEVVEVVCVCSSSSSSFQQPVAKKQRLRGRRPRHGEHMCWKNAFWEFADDVHAFGWHRFCTKCKKMRCIRHKRCANPNCIRYRP